MKHKTWIQTFTGKQFFPFEPRTEDICIEDIAHSLAHQCRFGGHCKTFYSVAEHSYIISTLASPDCALQGLMHDAAEAYLTDLPRPIKRDPRFSEHYYSAEETLLKVIFEKFSIHYPIGNEILALDEIMLGTEALNLMSPAPASWGLKLFPLTDFEINPMPPSSAETMFLQRFKELTKG